MDWKPNTPVFIRSLKKEGTILRRHRPGFYDVAIGSLTLQIAGSDLEKTSGKPQREPKKRTHTKSHRASKSTPSRSMSVDLHGMTVAEALEVVAIRVDEALRADADRLDIMHGIGSGKLKSAVHHYLAGLSVVKAYRLEKQNPGVTCVYF